MSGRRDFGFVEWFRPGEHDRVLRAVDGMVDLGARFIRTHLSWATYHTPDGAAWYDWLIPTLSKKLTLLPCIHYTPPSLSRTNRSSGPPRRLGDFADFVDHILTRYGTHFEHIELWNEPNNLLDWDWREDQEWWLFSEMVGAATWWARKRGWKPVLGGPCPFDPHWLSLMGERGVLQTVDAVGFHAFPGTWDSEAGGWLGYDAHLQTMRSVLDRYNPAAQIWITEAGYSTWRNDEIEQVGRFREALSAPADRMYWYGWQDIPTDVPVQEGAYFDPRHYHLGVTDTAGRPKLLHRVLRSGGLDTWGKQRPAAGPRIVRPKAPVAIFGGAGFVGANLADSLMRDGNDVIVFDNLSRPGVERNLRWLASAHGGRLLFTPGDIRDPQAVSAVVREASGIFHLAAQVAVTSSLTDPQDDFGINAQGTLTILEAMRRSAPETPLVFASTNKVYGSLTDLDVIERRDRYELPAGHRLEQGINEHQPLAFCTPYGCSKGVADQYVLDFAHSFGLRTAVLRKSCIYGPRQFGTEDQGWLAHFVIRALRNETICIYGDGKQVRDVLHVSDAVAAYRQALEQIDTVRGEAFNLGGGMSNAISLRQALAEIARIGGQPPAVTYAPARTGDQLLFVSDTGKLRAATGWEPNIGWRDGLRKLADWLTQDLALPVRQSRPTRRSVPA